MENTKDLVRAERGSRFVCQVGGTPAAPLPEDPLKLLDPAPWPAPSHAPSTSRAPLPLPAVKRFRGSPPPILSARDLSGFSLHCVLWEKNFRRKFSSASRLLPLQLWLGRKAGFETLLFLAAQGGRVKSSLSPRGHSCSALQGKAPLRFGASAARHFARGGGNIERGRGGQVVGGRGGSGVWAAAA